MHKILQILQNLILKGNTTDARAVWLSIQWKIPPPKVWSETTQLLGDENQHRVAKSCWCFN